MGGNNARKIGNSGRGQKNKKKEKKENKKDPFQGASFASGIVVEVGCMCQNRRKGHYGSRSGAVVTIIKSQANQNTPPIITAFIPGDGGSNFVEKGDEVLMSHRKRSDMRTVKHQVVKVRHVALNSLIDGKKMHALG